ncbi:hypothetical protein ACWIID_09110 [Streptomyces phaeochromogenes]
MSVKIVLPGKSGMYEDEGVEVHHQSSSDVRYSFEINNGGALIIWERPAGAERTVEAAYGPGAWIKASGATS